MILKGIGCPDRGIVVVWSPVNQAYFIMFVRPGTDVRDGSVLRVVSDKASMLDEVKRICERRPSGLANLADTA